MRKFALSIAAMLALATMVALPSAWASPASAGAASGADRAGGAAVESTVGEQHTACLDRADSTCGIIHVEISNFAFHPPSLDVRVGDTVVWTNADAVGHTATVSTGPWRFDSGLLQRGEWYSYTFTTPGTYQYYCGPHPFMRGSVTVR
jgi:amicyanin